MTQIFVNPEELKRFAHNLKQFNDELRERICQLNVQFLQVRATWCDKEHQKFAYEFQQTMTVMRKFLLMADVHIPFLLMKADRIQAYLGTKEYNGISGTSNITSTSNGYDCQLSYEKDDFQFKDKQGRIIEIKVDNSIPISELLSEDTGRTDNFMRLKAYHQDSQIGYCNITLEIDKNFNNDTMHYDSINKIRLRINDIQTNKDFRSSGAGTVLLKKAEYIAQDAGVSEIYGVLSYEEDEEDATRGFYRKNGYQFRFIGQREEIYKAFK